MSYEEKAKDKAREFIGELTEEIIENLVAKGSTPEHYANYRGGDTFYCESVTLDVVPTEAVAVMEELYQHEETDSGLWEGLGILEALNACAVATFKNAVVRATNGFLTEINENFDYWFCEQYSGYIDWDDRGAVEAARAVLQPLMEQYIKDQL
jgi:hypothetical protein